MACVAAIAGTMSWAAQPDYVAMAGQLTPQKSTEIAGILDTEKHPLEPEFFRVNGVRPEQRRRQGANGIGIEHQSGE